MSKISKKVAKDEIDQFETIDDFKKEKLANKKNRLTFVGVEKDKMASDNGFSKKQLEQIAQVVVATVQPMIQPIHDDIRDIKSRLDVLETKVDRIEKDIKGIKSTPTMSRELKQIKK